MLDQVLACVEHFESRPTERRKGNVKEWNKGHAEARREGDSVGVTTGK
jgi:hypothetical protein